MSIQYGFLPIITKHITINIDKQSWFNVYHDEPYGDLAYSAPAQVFPCFWLALCVSRTDRAHSNDSAPEKLRVLISMPMGDKTTKN